MNRVLRVLATGAATGLATALGYVGVRRLRERTGGPQWEPPLPRTGDPEPVLGYDGMDLQTVVPWLQSAALDRATLRRIRDYEREHRARETVLATLDELLR